MLNGKRPILRSLRALAAALGAVLALQAQTEPQLLTQTDTLDVYKSDAGKPTLVSVMDSMTGSRAVFEPSKYITMPTRAGWLGDKQGAIPFQDVFGNAFNVSTPRKSTDQVQAGKDLGFIFVLRSGTNEVYLLQWPNTKTLFRDDTGNVVMGHGYDFRSSFTPAGSAAVPYSTNDLNTIKQFTHVRFSVKIANGTTRTIDFPCPSQLFNSPYPFTSADAYNAGVAANVSSTSTGGIVYDLWSNRHGTLADMESNVDVVPYTNAQPARTGTAGTPGVAIQTALNATLDLGTTESNPYKWYTYVGIGNFFYSFDYFAWICGAQYVRNTTSDGLTAAPTTGIYASPSGYAVPDIGETVTYPTSISGNVASTSTGIAEGWKNGLPVMTRYQSMKVAAINVYSDFSGVITWVYRYLDAYVDNSANSEEGGGALSAASIPTNPDQSVIATDGTRANRMFVRALKLADLQSNTTSLQIMGPQGWHQPRQVSGPAWETLSGSKPESSRGSRRKR